MLCDHCLTESLVVLVPDSLHLSSAGSDFILQPRRCHINVYHTSDSLSVEDVLCGLCIDHQHRFHRASETTHHRYDSLRF